MVVVQGTNKDSPAERWFKCGEKKKKSGKGPPTFKLTEHRKDVGIPFQTLPSKKAGLLAMLVQKTQEVQKGQ